MAAAVLGRLPPFLLPGVSARGGEVIVIIISLFCEDAHGPRDVNSRYPAICECQVNFEVLKKCQVWPRSAMEVQVFRQVGIKLLGAIYRRSN